MSELARLDSAVLRNASRELLLHALYEAAELEHNLMCTYLYAAFALKSGVDEGLSTAEAPVVARWRKEILAIAVDEMSHLTAVWNITSSLGGVPRFGRTNFPLDPGYLPAGVVVRLAPLSEVVLQHFIYLERPYDADEPDGEGFAPERAFRRGTTGIRLTPMGLDYATVGEFYAALGEGLRGLVAHVGESAAFGGDPALQLSLSEIALPGAQRVICLKSALALFNSIVLQGEGAPENTAGSHFQRFCAIRAEYRALKLANPSFVPSHPAANNPVLRRPPRPEGRVWIEAEPSIAAVDLCNAAYGLMLRLLGYAYTVPAPHPDKSLSIDLAMGLMRAMTAVGEHAARLPAGPGNMGCNAGVSFTTLRDSAPLAQGVAARRFFVERFAELADAATAMQPKDQPRLASSARAFHALAERAANRFDLAASVDGAATSNTPAVTVAPVPSTTAASTLEMPAASSGMETVDSAALTLTYEAKRCIHARFCVTGAPTVFLANVQGPWLHPETLPVERLVAVSQECPSGAIQYRRKDGGAEELPPPVNLLAIREAGPYAIRAPITLDGANIGFRVTLCRCGASKNKPFCDSSHHDIGFTASGEPGSGETAMLPLRDGPLSIDPETDGPLQVRGNLEITSGTGRVVARVVTARLCRCGGSASKPFCDGTHARIGFRS